MHLLDDQFDLSDAEPGDEVEALRFHRPIDAADVALMRHLFNRYDKRTPTEAVRILGAFEVQTRGEVVSCDDGYLAVDADGYPYPIPLSVFEATYQRSSAEPENLRSTEDALHKAALATVEALIGNVDPETEEVFDQLITALEAYERARFKL